MSLPVSARGISVLVEQHFTAPLQVLGELPRLFINLCWALLIGHGQFIAKDDQARGIANVTCKSHVQLPVIRSQALQYRLDTGIANGARSLLPMLQCLLCRACLGVNTQGHAGQNYTLDLTQAVITGHLRKNRRKHRVAGQQAVECPLQALWLQRPTDVQHANMAERAPVGAVLQLGQKILLLGEQGVTGVECLLICSAHAPASSF
ncbi:hypothetical protein D3C76_1153950 [compost metagenome]